MLKAIGAISITTVCGQSKPPFYVCDKTGSECLVGLLNCHVYGQL